MTLGGIRDAKSSERSEHACANFFPQCANYWPIRLFYAIIRCFTQIFRHFNANFLHFSRLFVLSFSEAENTLVLILTLFACLGGIGPK